VTPRSETRSETASENLEGGVFELAAGSPAVRIGGEGSELVVDPSAKSGARIRSESSGWLIEPLEHGPRILLNERALAAPRRLERGDRLRIGASEIEVASSVETLRLRWETPDSGTAPPDVALPSAGPAGAGAPEASAGIPIAAHAQVVTAAEFRPKQARAAGTRASGSGSRFSLRGSLLTVAGAMLLVFAVFAFTSVSVQVLIEPEPESVALSGTWPALQLGGYFLVRPGDYAVEAELAGYRLEDARVRVDRSENQRFAFAMQRLPGRLSVVAEPVGASVFLDGTEIGQAPIDAVEIESGTHVLRLQAPRYLNLEQSIQVEGGGAAQRFELQLTPNSAMIFVSTDPPGAAIAVDGRQVGETPGSVDVEAGEHTLELSLAGRKSVERRLIVAANAPQRLEGIALPELDGKLRVTSRPSGARLSLDGRYLGKTPLEIDLSPDREHELRLARPGYETATRSLDIQAAGKGAIDVALVAEVGRIKVNAKPEDAIVFVDGRRLGPATETYEVSTEPHRIELRKAGYESRSERVRARAGFLVALDLELAPKQVAPKPAQAGAAPPAVALPQRIRTSTGQELVLFRSPGAFEMGSGRREQGRRSNETPRRVELLRSFYLATREVRNAEFRRFDASHDSGEFRGLKLDGDDLPAVRVSWSRAVEFCNWLSAQDSLDPAYEKRGDTWALKQPIGTGYRLPTEAEWAFAARYAGGGEPRRYPWGNSLPVAPKSGNYADKSASSVSTTALKSYDDGYAGPAPVGSFPVGPQGLFDMGGNVAEWISDYYAIRPPTGSADPTGPESGEYRLIRGSSWNQASLTQLRLAYRDYGNEGREDVGLRIARYAE